MQSKGRSGEGALSVGLDATPLLGRRTGVGEFCIGALGALGQRADLEVSAFAVSWRRRGELKEHLPPDVGNHQHAMPARPLHWAWSHTPVPPIELFVGSLDVVHGTNYVVPPTRRAARVVTVHDLTSVRYPELCDPSTLAFPRLVRRAVDNGAWVHTPSRFVAEEVVSELGVDPKRVRAVYHGIPGFRNGPQGADRDLAAEDSKRDCQRRRVVADISAMTLRPISRFVLAVGTIEPRKDYPLLVRAFDEIAGEKTDVALVIAGGEGWGRESFDRALEKAVHRDSVLRLGFVESDRLESLVRSAAAVVYPSVYEGFGFVPLQAMAAGVPVVATAAGAVPEVAGDGALLVPMGDSAALAHALLEVLDDEATRLDLVARGVRRASTFSWTTCAEGLFGIYTDAAR